jgi:hypothetical protein
MSVLIRVTPVTDVGVPTRALYDNLQKSSSRLNYYDTDLQQIYSLTRGKDTCKEY